MIRLHTSIRERNVHETLPIALRKAKELGVSRITCTTFLDQIGIPVYVAVRPDAAKGSLCVAAGKGLTMEEARVGACMEAIEFALSEPRNSFSKTIIAPYRAVLNHGDLLDLCPIIGTEINLEDEIPCVTGIDLMSGGSLLIPAELAFIPFEIKGGVFGNHTNGLASGNTFEEACVHAIYEVIERDILSFESLKDTSILIDELDLTFCQPWMSKMRNVGLDIIIRMIPNIYSLPFFVANIVDGNQRHPAYISSGYGLHHDHQIACMRAITEAAQTRLTFIHGGRDDLIEKHAAYENMDGEKLRNLFQENWNRLKGKSTINSYTFDHFTSIKEEKMMDHLNNLLKDLSELGIKNVIAISHTHPGDQLQVVKVIIPKLEFFNAESKRVGPRLKNYAEYVASNTFCRPEFESSIKGFTDRVGP
ncbi:MAG: YcaO-like family protein [Saprospiraceae bacterium]|nr:YcaO-like family protein [Saprospiraceae bacterium]